MHLKLVNFRGHKKLELTIPDTGLVLLQGKSGAGKSTVLTAIEFAFFGKTKKPYHFGTTTCSVTLRVGELVIYRSKSPNRLVVTLDDGQTAEDAQAESLIRNAIGLCEEEFLASSYIKQKTDGSLLHMTSAKKLEFMEKVAFHSESMYSVNDIKKKCNECIINIKDKSTKKLGEYEYASKKLTELKQKSLTKPKNIKDLENFETEYEENRSKLSRLRIDLEKLQEEQLQYNKHCDITRRVEELGSTIKEKQDQIDQELEKLGKPWKKRSEKEAQDLLGDLEKIINMRVTLRDKKKQYTSQKDDMTKELETLPVVNIQKYRRNLEELEQIQIQYEKQKLCIQRLDELNLSHDLDHEIKKISRKIDEGNKIWLGPCPNCGTNLQKYGDVLVVGVKRRKTLSDVEKYEDTLNELKNMKDTVGLIKHELVSQKEQIKKLETDILHYEKLEKRRHTLESNLKYLHESLWIKDIVPFEENLNSFERKFSKDQIQNVEEKKIKIQKYLQKNQNLQKDRNILLVERTCKDLYLELNRYQNKLEGCPTDKSLKIKTVQTEINQLEFFLDASHVQRRAYDEYKEYKSHKSQIKSLKSETKLLKKEHDKLVKELDGYSQLKDKISISEGLALDAAVASINEYANQFLKKMFKDDTISVTLETFKQLKTTKVVKPEITTIIEYRGFKYDDIDQLSGGERERLSLAYVLALNKLFGSKIVMLDESIASLDTLLNAEIFGYLREYSINKLVLVVSHEANPGLFDKIIQIG